MSGELPKGSLEPEAASAEPERLSWREKRWQRRRRRRMAEEVLGWILVPLIVLAGYGFLKVILGALGTSPSAVIAGLSTLMSSLDRL